jgi:hypothetical protein
MAVRRQSAPTASNGPPCGRKGKGTSQIGLGENTQIPPSDERAKCYPLMAPVVIFVWDIRNSPDEQTTRPGEHIMTCSRQV